MKIKKTFCYWRTHNLHTTVLMDYVQRDLLEIRNQSDCKVLPGLAAAKVEACSLLIIL